MRNPVTLTTLATLAAACLLAGSASAQDAPFSPFVDADIVEIVTIDPDGDTRETKIWIVVLDGAGYVRTNDSRWLANIRRDSPVALRYDDVELDVLASEVVDLVVQERVEAAFKAKYGAMQRIMSFFRISDPTCLRLDVKPKTIATAGQTRD